jgi:ATP-dependent protease Clp ATPase subunit
MPPRNSAANGSKPKSGRASEASSPGKKSSPTKKRSGTAPADHDDDDESVDSRGNIRGLIAYSEEEDEETDISDLTPKDRETIRRASRRAAVKARDKVRSILEKEDKSSSSKTSEDDNVVPPKKSKGFVPKKKVKPIVEVEEDDEDEEDEYEDDYEDDDEDEDEDEEEEDEDDYEDDDDEEEGRRGRRAGPAEFSISFTSAGGEEGATNKMVPMRHNMKKESEQVRKFVKLVTEPLDSGGIDEQIDHFKSLPEAKQAEMLKALERPASQQENIMFKILGMNVSQSIKSVILAKYHMIQNMDPSSGEYFKHRAWLEKATALPLGNYKEMPVKLDQGTDACSAFMERARKCMSTAICGQEESKLQILQFIASRIANPSASGMSLLLVGPPGIGKTSLIKNGIAAALDYPFQFISLGGDSDASTYTGHQLVYEGSHAGKIVNSLISSKSMSMIMMFDELDKISATPKGEEIQNLLVHMTDSVQNCEFEDKYLTGIPLDLSRVMFAFSANDITKIDKVLLDRMVVINLKGYEKKEKTEIAENYIIPAALKAVNLDERVAISKEIIEHIITEYAKEEAGVRELKRCIEQIVQKINMLRIFNTKDLPFHIPDFTLPFVLKRAHVDLFLKKKGGEIDVSAMRMYS